MTDKPHDALFRATFSQVEHAAETLRALLPVEVAQNIDWATLEIAQGNFVTDELRAHATDLLFRTRLVDGSEARIYLLFEHQSSVDPWMPLRLLEYIVALWSEVRREGGPAVLPIVLPIVLHHSDGGWRAPTNLTHLFRVSPQIMRNIEPFLPTFEFILDDLSTQDSHAVRLRAGTALARLAQWCLASVRDRRFFTELGDWADVYAEIVRMDEEAVPMLMRYIHLVSDADISTVQKVLLDALGPHAKEEYVTTGQKLIEQGHTEGLKRGLEKGRQEGRQEGRRLTLIKLIELKFGRIPAPAYALLDAGDAKQVDLWTERVLDASTLDELLAT